MKKESSFWKSRIGKGLQIILALVALIAVLRLVGITCLIRFFTGVSCPGCGMTRAWIAFAGGHFDQAMAYHPLFWILVPAAGYLLVREIVIQRGGVTAAHFRKADRILLSVFCLSMILCYCVRMADPCDEVVVFRPGDGVFFRLINLL